MSKKTNSIIWGNLQFTRADAIFEGCEDPGAIAVLSYVHPVGKPMTKQRHLIGIIRKGAKSSPKRFFYPEPDFSFRPMTLLTISRFISELMSGDIYVRKGGVYFKEKKLKASIKGNPSE